jgi:hypothetical protein
MSVNWELDEGTVGCLKLVKLHIADSIAFYFGPTQPSTAPGKGEGAPQRSPINPS